MCPFVFLSVRILSIFKVYTVLAYSSTSFHLLAEYYSIVCTFCLSIYLLILELFPPLHIVSSAVMKSSVQVFIWVPGFHYFSYLLRNRIGRLNSNSLSSQGTTKLFSQVLYFTFLVSFNYGQIRQLV